MRKFFILLVMLVTSWSLFSEGNLKERHTCTDYFYTTNGFIPNWFDHLEEADNKSGYSKEFLQEHGGRAGALVYRYKTENDVDCEENDDDYEEHDNDWEYDVMCSGTLIGENHFITAGHCAVTEAPTQNGCKKLKHLGVLFGYQKADFEDNDDDEINDDDNNVSGYPRVSLKGYLDENRIYRLYGEEVPDMDIYPDYDWHPAYFPIVDRGIYKDGSVEHGWEMTDDDNDKVDYAIYELGTNKQEDWPAQALDPWPWNSPNNQLSQNTLDPDQIMPWELPDNTNGKRGWTRVNTSVLQAGTDLNVIGSPRVAWIFDGTDPYPGLKVVNAGYVIDGAAKKNGHSFKEDVLTFERADIKIGHSGSSVIDSSGKVAGVASWVGCWDGAPGNGPEDITPSVIPVPPSTPIPLNVQYYATPMWRICQVSQIIKDAARDQDCNGLIDWQDLVLSTKFKVTHFKNVGIDSNLIHNFEIPTTVEEIQIYRFNMDQKKVIAETRIIPANTYQVAWSDNGDFFYVAKQNNIYSLFKNGTSIGTISSYPALSGSSTLVKGNDIYLAGGDVSGVSDQGLINNADTQYITKISSNGQNGYVFSLVAAFPENLEDIRIFSLGNDIYVTGNTDMNFVVYKLQANNQLAVVNNSQPVRKDYNLTASDGKIIVSGGATDYIRNVLNLNESQYDPNFAVYNNIIMLDSNFPDEWITVAENINDKLIMLSVTAIDDGNLVLVNPFITVGNSMQKFVIDLENIPVSGKDLRVSFEFHPIDFCLAESGNNEIAGGLEQSGECVMFTHPWYKSLSAGTTVYSIAGKENRLYVGTNDSIKIYDISDANTFTLVSTFSTNNARVYDMEIEGNTLFAATSKGLYKLDATDPDELTQTLFVATSSNNQYEIELYDGKVYVGDDYGIKIRDKETLSVLSSANSGAIYDFAIQSGEIAMFRSSFLNSGIQFRDAETLVETAYDYTSCSNAEIETYNGRFYLACDNYTYSFEANNGYIYFTQLTGDKRELQEVYTYNGYTYIPDGNTIKLSTHEDVSALCGNGIVEGDEVCDGGQIDCDELDSSYVSGIAACNSTCDGYVLDNCTAGNGGDGW